MWFSPEALVTTAVVQSSIDREGLSDVDGKWILQHVCCGVRVLHLDTAAVFNTSLSSVYFWVKCMESLAACLYIDMGSQEEHNEGSCK